ncbi:noelin-3 [Platysternon megacephalum]|uniref:Noelin-3 n=1 Tax=Platysternon megacephalum TaxID=55544 RepID=A0A4D9E7B1_9SAUR|nr:noelin-3 [Platysternon megacephalum]
MHFSSVSVQYPQTQPPMGLEKGGERIRPGHPLGLEAGLRAPRVNCGSIPYTSRPTPGVGSWRGPAAPTSLEAAAAAQVAAGERALGSPCSRQARGVSPPGEGRGRAGPGGGWRHWGGGVGESGDGRERPRGSPAECGGHSAPMKSCPSHRDLGTRVPFFPWVTPVK